MSNWSLAISYDEKDKYAHLTIGCLFYGNFFEEKSWCICWRDSSNFTNEKVYRSVLTVTSFQCYCGWLATAFSFPFLVALYDFLHVHTSYIFSMLLKSVGSWWRKVNKLNSRNNRNDGIPGTTNQKRYLRVRSINSVVPLPAHKRPTSIHII